MLADTLEYIQRLLFDLKYDRNIQESVLFYFFYLAVQWYLIVGFSILADHYNSFFFAVLTIASPFLLNIALAIGIVIKKNLKDNFSYILVILTILGAIFGPGAALMPVMVLATTWDNSPEGIIKKMEKEQLEHDIEIERQLWIEQSAKKIEEAKIYRENTKEKGARDEKD